MRKSKFSDEQIAHALRQAEAGTPINEIARKLGISETTFYGWKKRLAAWVQRRSPAPIATRTASEPVE